jgi:hypothetical protein
MITQVSKNITELPEILMFQMNRFVNVGRYDMKIYEKHVVN